MRTRLASHTTRPVWLTSYQCCHLVPTSSTTSTYWFTNKTHLSFGPSLCFYNLDSCSIVLLARSERFVICHILSALRGPHWFIHEDCAICWSMRGPHWYIHKDCVMFWVHERPTLIYSWRLCHLLVHHFGHPVRWLCRNLLYDSVHLETQALDLFVPTRQGLTCWKIKTQTL